MTWKLFSKRLGLTDEIAWWTRTLSREMNSLVGRICVLRERRTGLPPNDLGPLYRVQGSASERLVMSAEPFARNASIQKICSKYRWVSVADVMLVLEGWDMGKEYSDYTLDTVYTETGKALPLI